jgi:hypothetical protein
LGSPSTAASASVETIALRSRIVGPLTGCTEGIRLPGAGAAPIGADISRSDAIHQQADSAAEIVADIMRLDIR